MKRLLPIFMVILILALLLTGCSKTKAATYKLTKVSAEGTSFTPSSLGLNFTFTLSPNGTGVGTYNNTTVDLSWHESGSKVIVEGINGTLEFEKVGDNLILHDESSILTFELQEEEST